MMHSCDEGVDLVDLNILVGEGLSTLLGLRADTQAEKKLGSQ